VYKLIRIYLNFDDILKKNYNKSTNLKEYEPIKEKIFKLYDHINLEYLRMINDTSVTKLLNNIEEKIENLHTKATETEKSLKDQTTTFVTILGIFSALVITFMSGLVFSSSIFSNLATAHIYKIGALSALVGIVTLSMLYFLFYFIKSVTSKTQDSKFFSWVFGGIILLLLAVFLRLVCLEIQREDKPKYTQNIDINLPSQIHTNIQPKKAVDTININEVESSKVNSSSSNNIEQNTNTNKSEW
ncbi:MAG: hypothetical protein ACK5LP_00615, partial [Campylobacteraceae bacterium]